MKAVPKGNNLRGKSVIKACILMSIPASVPVYICSAGSGNIWGVFQIFVGGWQHRL